EEGAAACSMKTRRRAGEPCASPILPARNGATVPLQAASAAIRFGAAYGLRPGVFANGGPIAWTLAEEYTVKPQTIRTAIVAALLAAGPAWVAAAQQQTPPDNTRVNARDSAAGDPTADQGRNNKPASEIMKEIPKSVVDDHGLSSY